MTNGISVEARSPGASAPPRGTFSPADFITGERLQALADVTVTTPPIMAFHRSLPRNVRTVCFPGDMRRLVVDSEERLAPLRTARSIFVYTHILQAFAETVIPRLTRPFVLLTHNSDFVIGQGWRPLADHPLIKRWFAQNLLFDHPKLDALPIGVANAQWPHGDLDALADVISQNLPKQRLLYVNFKIETNPAVRRPLYDFLAGLPHATVAPERPYGAYLREMAEFRYCVSPPGNGIDCHRTWEALYLGVVPIVARETSHRFPDMKVMPFSGPADFAAARLDAVYDSLIGHPGERARLTLDWWRDRVRRAVVDS